MIRLSHLAAAVLLAVAGTAQAEPAPTSETLLAAEDARFAAQVSGDAAALQSGIAEEAVFAHAAGFHQHKADFLAGVASGRMAYHAVRTHDRAALVSGTIGVVRGFVDIDIADRTSQNSYLAVYTWRDHRWQLLDWQTGAATPPAKP
jgi:hypothetical protein